MDLKDIIQRIDSLKAELDKFRLIDPEREQRIMQKFRLDWNFHSNNLEGNSLTYGETKSFLLHGITASGKPLKDHLDIKGHNEAILLLDDVIKQNRPLTESFIRESHKIILHEPYDRPALTPDGKPTTKRIEIGQYKTQPNHVKTQTGEIFYFATPEETPAKMHDLMEWFNKAKDDDSIHPLILASEFHYRFIRIHPFDDGNGRIARILMNLIFMMKGFPPVIIKTQEKEDYFRALRQADGGNIEAFVLYVGEQLIRSLELMVRAAKGEEIDEEEDIDKQIALFKASLMGMEDKVIWSKTVQKRVVKDSIIPILRRVFDRVAEFDELFVSRKISMTYSFWEDDLQVPTEITKVFSDIPDFWLSGEELLYSKSDIRISYEWKEFVKSGVKSFDCDLSIVIHFHRYSYEIRSIVNKKLVVTDSIGYNEIMTQERGKSLIARVVKHILTVLENSINGDQ